MKTFICDCITQSNSKISTQFFENKTWRTPLLKLLWPRFWSTVKKIMTLLCWVLLSFQLMELNETPKNLKKSYVIHMRETVMSCHTWFKNEISKTNLALSTLIIPTASQNSRSFFSCIHMLKHKMLRVWSRKNKRTII